MNLFAELTTEAAAVQRVKPAEIRRQAALFCEMPLLGMLFDSLPVIVMILNEQRQVVFANRLLAEAIGVQDIDRIIGLRPGETIGCVHAYQRPTGCGTSRFCNECGALRAVQSALQGKQAVQDCNITRNVNGRVEALDLRVWTTPFFYQGEQFVMLAMLDVANEKRRQNQERIFFHDISNLASVLQWGAQLLPQAADEQRGNLVDMMGTTSARLMEEIRAQKDLAAAENYTLEIHTSEIDAEIFLRQIVDTYAHHPVASERKLVIAPDSQKRLFVSDEVLLGRVLGNMIKNALEASEPGQTVTAGFRDLGKEVEFWVHNPTTMPLSTQNQIFNRSFSTKGTGRGLGTYSMKLLSETYMHGEVQFTSSETEGTVFTARYPRRLDEAARI